MKIVPSGDEPIPGAYKDGSSGWSGTKTSRDAMEHIDYEQISSKFRKQIYAYLVGSGNDGMTVSELEPFFPDRHHGTVSSACTNMHKAGYIARLKETRTSLRSGRECHVYVTWPAVNDRELEPYVPTAIAKCPNCGFSASD